MLELGSMSAYGRGRNLHPQGKVLARCHRAREVLTAALNDGRDLCVGATRIVMKERQRLDVGCAS
jgi:hypothetical protein